MTPRGSQLYSREVPVSNEPAPSNQRGLEFAQTKRTLTRGLCELCPYEHAVISDLKVVGVANSGEGLAEFPALCTLKNAKIRVNGRQTALDVLFEEPAERLRGGAGARPTDPRSVDPQPESAHTTLPFGAHERRAKKAWVTQRRECGMERTQRTPSAGATTAAKCPTISALGVSVSLSQSAKRVSVMPLRWPSSTCAKALAFRTRARRSLRNSSSTMDAAGRRRCLRADGRAMVRASVRGEFTVTDYTQVVGPTSHVIDRPAQRITDQEYLRFLAQNKRRLSFRRVAFELVAGAGFEPATFGL